MNLTNQIKDYSLTPVSELDPELNETLNLELTRQKNSLEMIASENFVPYAILEVQGSVLTNKYAEGYPGNRYYGGCEEVDKAENLAISRAKDLFQADYVNVQPHAGAQANAAALAAMLKPGETLLGLELSHGGHLTHGMKLNFSGRFYNAVSYKVDPKTYYINPEHVREQALKYRPQVIIAGWSSYSRELNFNDFKDIAKEVNAHLMVDMAHFAGLVAAGMHSNPVPIADVTTTTIHKTLCGPRSGMILSNNKEKWGKKLDTALFPGEQGGPLMHIVAAKALAFKLAKTEQFKDRIKRTLSGAKIVAKRLNEPDMQALGVKVLTGGTDVHQLVIDLRGYALSGKQTQELLGTAGITINKNSIPFDQRAPQETSGIRIGTQALATRGLQDLDFETVANLIASVLKNGSKGADLVDNSQISKVRENVIEICNNFPIYPNLSY